MLKIFNKNSPEEQKIIDTIRVLGLDMINEANSGHPGIVLGAAPILYTLYGKHLNFNPKDPLWINRDRFVLSAGHGSALLYSTLYLSGFNLSLDDLKNFRQLNSKTPGHPEYLFTPGVDITTGPLGQGIASSVGMAVAEKYLKEKYPTLIDHKVYTLVGDGDLMEGVSYEAISLAGTLKLDNLIVLYDSNNISLDGNLNLSYTENTRDRFLAANWEVLNVSDGEDIEEIDNAITKAKTHTKPTLIIINTVIGKYSKLENTHKAHGAPLSEEDLKQVKEKLDKRDVSFGVSKEDKELFQESIKNRIAGVYNSWLEEKDKIDPEIVSSLEKLEMGELSLDNIDIDYNLEEIEEEAPRVTSGKILNELAKANKVFIGGSADLSSSNKTYLDDQGDFSSTNYSGKNIFYGVREHAMGAISNGLTLSGIRNFTSTFLSFADYLKPSIRLASIMDLPNIYVFTHDSIFVGQDGPTHQPVEQLAMLRSTPNLDVYRPADVNEVLGVYKHIASQDKTPSAVILARNSLPVLSNTSVKDVEKGAYIVHKEEERLDGIIISSGEELSYSVDVATKLKEEGINIRVVSMVSIELFNKQDDEYKKEILEEATKTIVIEASSSYSWHDFVYNKNYLITVDTFGKSAPDMDIRKDYGFDYESLLDRVRELLK